MHAPVLVTPPAANDPIITLAQAKVHLRMESAVTDEDAMVTALIEAATKHLDGYSGILGRALVMQTWRQDFDGFCSHLRLPIPAAAITELRWFAVDDVTGTVIAGANYEPQHDALGSFVRLVDDFDMPGDLAETRAVRVTYTAGYGAATAVPAAISLAMLLLVGHWYMNREAVVTGTATQLPMAVDALIAPHRRVGV